MNHSKNPPQHYTATAKILHWGMAIVLLGLVALGIYMHDLPFSPEKLQFYSWHKWAGVSAFFLVLFRLVWRITHRPPALPASMPTLLQWAAHAGHALLYILMLAIPLSGWLMSSAKGFQTVWFGVLPLPDLVAKDKALGESLATLHQGLNLLLGLTLLAHVGAALKHHFIDRDDILQRMLPFGAAVVVGLGAAGSVGSAQAVEFRQVQADKSTIGFSYQQMNVKMEGRFRQFTAQIAFDPAKPAAAKVSFNVALGSVDAGSGDADQELAGKSWFNTTQFPSAQFVASSVKALGNNQFEVAGKLTIKGQSRDIVIPAKLTPLGNTAALDGTFTIRRGDFSIGEGSWAKWDIVANDVVVRFHLIVS